MRIGDIGTISCSDEKQEAKLYRLVSEIPPMQGKEINTDTLEKLSRVYEKKYGFRLGVIYRTVNSYTASLYMLEPNGKTSVYSNTTIYALTSKELFAKLVLYYYYYVEQNKLR